MHEIIIHKIVNKLAWSGISSVATEILFGCDYRSISSHKIIPLDIYHI